MRREDVQEFHAVANPSRDGVYGVSASWNGKSISLACHVLSDMDLAAGGWERAGTMRALYSGLDGPAVHDQLRMEEPQYARFSKLWVVRSATPSAPHNSTSYVLEPIP
jgi:hypothetical protein